MRNNTINDGNDDIRDWKDRWMVRIWSFLLLATVSAIGLCVLFDLIKWVIVDARKLWAIF